MSRQQTIIALSVLVILLSVIVVFLGVALITHDSSQDAYERGKSDVYEVWVKRDSLQIWHTGFSSPPWPVDTTFVNRMLADKIDTFYLMTALYSYTDSVLIDMWGQIVVMGLPDPTETLPAVDKPTSTLDSIKIVPGYLEVRTVTTITAVDSVDALETREEE